tara:strand:+ start:692 stop:1219 length:528 start_codon:yes stop_codon:yes gene_type:complete
MAKRKKFTLKSGNNSSFKMMGASSPVEQDETTSDLDDFFSSANISAELEAMKNKRNEEAVPSTETTTTTDTEAFDIKNTEAYKKIKADAEARNQAAFDAETDLEVKFQTPQVIPVDDGTNWRESGDPQKIQVLQDDGSYKTISNPSGSGRKTVQDLIDAQNFFDETKKGVKPGGN